MEQMAYRNTEKQKTPSKNKDRHPMLHPNNYMLDFASDRSELIQTSDEDFLSLNWNI